MGVVVRRVQGVGIHGAQVLHLQLDETLCQLVLVSQADGKRIRLVLKLARHDVDEELQDSVDGRQDSVKQDETNEGRHGVDKAERLVQRLVVDENREHGKEPENIRLAER